MHEPVIISAAFGLFIFFLLMIRKPGSNALKNTIDAPEKHADFLKETSPANDTENTYANEENLNNEGQLPNQQDNGQQLQLALSLTEKALPVWKKYIANREFVYYTTSANNEGKIKSSLLHDSIEAIKLANKTRPADYEKNIKQLYNDFVNPVIDLQDGVWTTPYAVKKIFLSLYYLLKSMIENTGSNDKEIFLSAAIGYATDCLDLSNLYSSDEVTSFLEMYKTSR